MILFLAALTHTGKAQFTCATNDGAITITGYTGSSNNVVVPASTNGYPVTSVGDKAFFNGQQTYFRLTSITIPDSVTNIGYSAFYACSGLTNISLGSGVLAIGSNAFQGCSGLSNIFLPASVASLGSQAFINCTKLTAINVDANNTTYSSVGGILFDWNQAALIACPGGLTGSLVIPSIVTSIGNWAFAYCAGITNIAIPASVTNMGFEAFKYCSRLAEIDVDTNNPAFNSLGGVLFDRAQATLIQYPEGKTGAYTVPGNVANIGSEALYGCTNLTGIVLPAGLLNIGSSAFYQCTKLATANFPGGLTNVGDHAFYDCPSLTSAITLGDNLLNLGDYAFQFCGGLGKVSVGNGVTSIGSGVFYNCTGLTNVTLGANVTSIGADAFYYCGNLASFTFPAGVTNLGVFAFYYCTKLTAITIPGGVTSIGISVFQNCSALKNVTLPAGLASIGYNAFYYSGLVSVIIPAGVTNIGVNAFCYCGSLKSVFFEGNAPAEVDSSAFQYSPVTPYAPPGTAGWPVFTTATGLSVTPWLLPYPTILNFEPNFGIQTNGFGFTISWATNLNVVVDVCTDLAQGKWTPLATNNLAGGACAFSDPSWTNDPNRFYRLRAP